MKRTFLLLVGIVLTISLSAQPWKSNLPANKSKAELTFYDYQNAFNAYWEPLNVEKGFYTDENGKKQKAHGWKQFKRWEYLWESQIDIKTGAFPDVNPWDTYKDWQNQQTQKAPKSANWTVMGPNSSGGGYAGIGRINTVAFHPTDNDTYWIGAPAGGLWQTTDNGNTWSNTTDNNPVLGVSDILVFDDFESTNTMYIATGDRDAWDNRSIGVLKSTDGGATWNTTDISYTLADNMMVNRLLGDPNDNETIIAATSGGVYKTTDGGTTWDDQLFNIEFKDMEYNPSSYDTLYGSTTSGSVYRSTDGGENWDEVLSTGRSRVELAITPANDSIVYAIVANNNNGLYGIYQSRDFGATFTQVWNGTTSGQNLLGWYSGDDSGGQGWYDLSIAASPIDEDILLIGGVNTWRSENGGYNWDLVGHWYGGFGAQAVHADVHMIKYRENGDLFQTNDGGVYFSNSDGDVGTWVDKTNGMEISQIYKIGVAQTNDDEIILGLQDNGSKLTYDGNWIDVRGGDGMDCLIDYSDEDIQYATVYYGAIDRTTNHWASSTDVSAASNGAWVTPFVIDPHDPATLYAGYADIYKTTNRGDSWTKISNINSGSRFRSLAVSPSDPGFIYAADPYSIYKTTDDGDNWENISSGLPSNSITNIAVKSDDPNTVWVTLGGFDGNAIYESTDGGDNWTNISAGLPELPATSVVQNIFISNEVHLYIGTRIGVYFKKGDDDWISYNTNLPNVRISEVEIYYDNTDVNNSRLRAASYGRGLWESPLYFEGTYPPVVATTMATNVTMDEATINGTISADFGETITESGFLFGFTSDLTIGGADVMQFPTSPVVTSGDFSQSFVELDHSTTYYYRAYGINPNGTGYGSVRSFTTVAPESYEIKFEVTDGNGDGIWQAEIDIDGEILSTSPGGVVYTQLPDGAYTFDVTADGFNDLVGELFSVEGAPITVEVSMTTVGLETLEEDSFEIYPNPATENVYIRSEGKFTAELYSEDGKLMEQLHSNDKATLNVKEMTPGIYFIKIRNANKAATQRLIIK